MELNGAAALANAVRQARREAQLSQEEVAARSGMSRVSVARLEAGAANLTLDSLLRVANVLGMRLDATWDAAEAASHPLPRKRPRAVARHHEATAARKSAPATEQQPRDDAALARSAQTSRPPREPVDLNAVLARVSRDE